MGGLRMAIKTRIDGLTEAEAKAALERMINYAGALTSCNRCFLPPDCYGGKCKEAFLKWAIGAEALKEARK